MHSNFWNVFECKFCAVTKYKKYTLLFYYFQSFYSFTRFIFVNVNHSFFILLILQYIKFGKHYLRIMSTQLM